MADWEAVVSQNVAAVRRTVYRLVGNHADAWDCIQETFLEAVKIDRREPVRNWFCTAPAPGHRPSVGPVAETLKAAQPTQPGCGPGASHQP